MMALHSFPMFTLKRLAGASAIALIMAAQPVSGLTGSNGWFARAFAQDVNGPMPDIPDVADQSFDAEGSNPARPS